MHFEKALVLFIICSKCENEDKEKLKKNKKKVYNYFKNMTEKNISQEFRLKNIYETKNYFVEERDQNKLLSKKPHKICMIFNYIERFLIIASVVPWCISFSVFSWFFLLGIAIGITSSAIGLIPKL